MNLCSDCLECFLLFAIRFFHLSTIIRTYLYTHIYNTISVFLKEHSRPFLLPNFVLILTSKYILSISSFFPMVFKQCLLSMQCCYKTKINQLTFVLMSVLMPHFKSQYLQCTNAYNIVTLNTFLDFVCHYLLSFLLISFVIIFFLFI